MKNDSQIYSRAIYSRNAIEAAIVAYRHIASIKITENQTHYICVFGKCIVPVQRVICEFNNYLIELMNAPGEATDG